jgi:hypothetical protein
VHQPEVVLITTTINVPHVLTQWAKSMQSMDWIIVAGDLKSPHDEIIELLAGIEVEIGVNTRYIHPYAQQHWATSEHIGWNCIQRRNIALLEAISLKPKYILTIDDDNAPTSPLQVQHLVGVMEGKTDNFRVVSTNTGWYNPGRHVLTSRMKSIVHRGFPLSHRHDMPLVTMEAHRPNVGVAAMLWTGEPDIDAVERITNAPTIIRVDPVTVLLSPGTWAPFNTQATMIDAKFAPALFMFPHVGRYDDIWASYVVRKVMDMYDAGVYYGHPTVHQDRNPHNLVNDLKAEMFGMEFNEELIDILQSAELAGNDILEDLDVIYTTLAKNAHFLHRNTIYAMNRWLDTDLPRALNG